MFSIPALAGPSDPTITGAAIEWCRLDVIGACQSFSLPAGAWTGLGTPAGAKGYKYKGAGTPEDPCRSVLVKDKVIKASCKRADLTGPIGTAGVGFEIEMGADRYCAESSAITAAQIKKNDESTWKAIKATAPGACPVPPTPLAGCGTDNQCIFVTSTASTGDLGGLAGADATCNARAQAAGLPGTYVAFLSTSSVDAPGRLGASAGPFARTDGVIVGSSVADLCDESLAAPIELDEFGVLRQSSVWTGSRGDCTRDGSTCSNWTDGTATSAASVGNSAYDTLIWVAGAGLTCDHPSPFYCVQEGS